jgi:hypothetical protein
VLVAAQLPGCSSSSSAGPDATAFDVSAPANQCTAYGQGFVCQTGTACAAGFINKEDYFCGKTTEVCCGPVGEGGLDASDDVNVFVDGAVFEAGPRDAAEDAPKAMSDAGRHDAALDSGAHDAATDAGHSADAARDATPADAAHDAGRDAGHTDDAARDAPAHHDAGKATDAESHSDADHDAHS